MPIAGSESVISYVLRVGGGAGADVRSSITDEDCTGSPCVRAVAGRQHGLGGLSFRAVVQRRFALPRATFSPGLPSSM